MRHINRLQPQGTPQAYKTFQIVQPLATHFRPATCAEVDCPAHTSGWKSVIDESTDLGKQQAHYIRNVAGRRYTEGRAAAITTFTFEAGQQCFRPHQTPLERDPIHIVKDGDWRASQNPHQLRGDDWVDSFQNHQDQLKTRLERG